MSDRIVNDDRKEKKKKKRRIESVVDGDGDGDESLNAEKDRVRKKKKKKDDVGDRIAIEDAEKKKKKKKSMDEEDATNNANDKYLTSHKITLTTPSNLKISPMLSFSTLNSLPPSLIQSLHKFDEPTPIQACAWPAALLGLDVVGIAETGSGKTLAFCIPLVAHILNNQINPNYTIKPQIKALIIAPTRELAIQTHDTLSDLCSIPFPVHNSDANIKLTSVAVYGGVDKDSQRSLLAGANANSTGKKNKKPKSTSSSLIEIIAVVGTPGRIKDLVQEGSCDLSQVTYLVLDEADRMLDKGFENDIRQIIEFTTTSSTSTNSSSSGQRRQTLMFSATWPPSVRQLASTFLNEPVRITVGSDELTANSRVEQVLEVFDDEREKDSRLLKHLSTILSSPTTSKNSLILIFALYKLEAVRISQFLASHSSSSSSNNNNNTNKPNKTKPLLDLRISTIQGSLPQHLRLSALSSFKSGSSNILVATDVAARGLDIPNVNYVINYTFPLTVEDYVHRIGRTGRGHNTSSAVGKSITFFTGAKHEKALAGELAKLLREGGFDDQAKVLREKFPMTIRKKVHSVYGSWFREDLRGDDGKEGEGGGGAKATHLVFE